MLVIMRRLERALHQHLFKVGWLATKDFQTTTLLYYLLFIPGVALNQFILYIVAGILNIRAELPIAWPKAQEVAELRLNFVKLAKVTNPFKSALLNIAPLVAGLLAIYIIANSILRIGSYVTLLNNGQIADVGELLRLITSAPDVWLWVYLIFTIANTMMPPDFRALAGSRPLLITLAIIVALIVLLGLGNAILGYLVNGPLLQGVNALSGVIGVVIAIDLLFLALLGAVESLIERVTGDSATFQNGKLIAVRRAERRQQREQQRLKAAKQAQQKATRFRSVYELPFPLPTPPGKEEPINVRRENGAVLGTGLSTEEGRAGASLIAGTAVVRRETSEPAQELDED